MPAEAVSFAVAPVGLLRFVPLVESTLSVGCVRRDKRRQWGSGSVQPLVGTLNLPWRSNRRTEAAECLWRLLEASRTPLELLRSSKMSAGIEKSRTGPWVRWKT